MQAWWKERVVYQIYPRSFYDADDDGMGDLKGILAKLDVLAELGVGILWLSPVYRSPQTDNGYDIADYTAIDPMFGTMEDMDTLIKEAGKRDIKIVMDLVINHTSDQHDWFQQSRKRIEPYTDYYIWRDGKDGGPPNNWTSFFAGDAWTYDSVRGQYYLHLFTPQQPDLNYHNPAVLADVKRLMRFWLDKGVAGFRCDVINILFKTTLVDGKRQLVLKGLEHYLSQEGLHDILKQLRSEVLNDYDAFTVGETVFVTPSMARDLCEPERNELDMVFSFEHMDADQFYIKWFKRRFRPKFFFRTLAKWQNELSWNANYFENHDQLRSVSRFGDDKRYWRESATCLATLLLSLKGTPFVYQGQEIGMTNFDIASMTGIQDVESHNVYRFLRKLHVPKAIVWRMIRRSSRDNVRTPMQWSDEPNAGFTSATPWLKVNDNHTKINLASQRQDPDSIWAYYQTLIHLRNENKILQYGTFQAHRITRRLFVFERTYEGDTIYVAINLSPKRQRVPYSGEVLVSNYDITQFDGRLAPYQAVLWKG
jgi:oligo-1,6-glucosidase